MTPQEIKAELHRRGMTIRDLAEAIDLNENYLGKSLGPAGRKLKVHEMDAIRKELAPTSEHEPLRSIPLLGEVPAGKPQPAGEHRGRWHPVSDPDTPANAYALVVKGDSMDLVVQDGATLIIDPDDKELWPDNCYIIRTEDGEATFKEYQNHPARLVPCSSNEHHKEIKLGEEPVHILGRVWAYTTRTKPKRAT